MTTSWDKHADKMRMRKTCARDVHCFFTPSRLPDVLQGLQAVDHAFVGLVALEDKFVSTSSDRCMLLVHAFACLLRLVSSHCADSMVLVYTLHSVKVSMISRSDFFSCCSVGMVFQCDFIVLNDTFLNPPNI